MGGALQKILQGRGGQTRHGIRVKRVLPPSLLLLSYIGLLFHFPSAKPVLWFSLTLFSIAVYLYFSYIKRKREYLFETISSFGLFIAGVSELLSYHWLHLAYLPFLIALSFVYRKELIIPLSLTVPLLEVGHFVKGDLAEEIFFNIAAVLTGILLSTAVSKLKTERDAARKSLFMLREEAEDIDSMTGMEGISRDALLSEHLSSTSKANEEIREILLIAKHVLSADSASMFTLRGNIFALRSSSDEVAESGAADRGEMASCVKRKETAVSTTPSAGRNATSSFIATPVMEGNFVAGVLTARRNGKHPFGDHDRKTFEMFSRQVVNILRKQRIHSQINREHAGLKILHRGSSSLITSLKIDGIAQNLIEAAYKIAPLSMLFFVSRGGRYELIHQIGFAPPGERLFDFANSLVGMAVRNGEPLYFSDLRSNRVPVLPFKAGHAGSVFMLPLLYEKEVLGVLVFLSERTNALNSYQIELLEVLGNQASSSLANAKFHHEIERMAITDGLTGLYNHRHFQERLTSELRRLQRFSDPLSLLIVDIDFFKKINDSYGHPAGDEILREVAGIIRETVRNIDVPARYGGEEFAAILLGTGHEGARKMAERLRKSVMDRTFPMDGNDLKVTVSIGAATSPYDGESKEEIIEKADRALYHAKRNGRNCCVLWNEIQTPQ